MTDPRRDDIHESETYDGASPPGAVGDVTPPPDHEDAHEMETSDGAVHSHGHHSGHGAHHDGSEAETSDGTSTRRPSSTSSSAVPPGFRTVDGDAATIDSKVSEGKSAGPPLPKTVGRYRIVRLIGAGGMGAVYEAEQDSPRRSVALKLMKSGIASKAAMRRFEYESQVLGRLRHPGIAQVFEAGVHDDGTGAVPYFAMEYIPDAKTLTDYAQKNNLSSRQRMELFIKVCEAVHHGHQKGIIHRDLKPDNILVDSSGQPKIIDFGVARTTDSDVAAMTVQTEVGQLVGTVPYMSPEQIEADPADIDTRSDVYGLGVVLYKLLTGKLPYDLTGTPVYEATRIIREQPPLRLSTVDHHLKGDVETIVLHALEKDRDRRYQSAFALAQDIERYLNDEPILARPPSLLYVWSRFAKRNKLLVGSAAVVFVLLVGGVIGTTTGMVKAQQNYQTAVEEINNQKKTSAYFFGKLGQTVDARRDEVDIEGKAADAKVVDFMRLAVRDADKELAEFPKVHATVLSAMGFGYKSLTDFDIAEDLYRKSLAIQRTIYDPPSEELAQTLLDLGSVLWQTNRYEEAEPYFRESLEMYQELYEGQDNDELARSMDYLAANLSRLHKYKEAVDLYRKSLDMRRRISTPAVIARSVNNLGMCLRDQGEYREAAEAIKEATDITRKERGDDHIDVANGLTNHATCLLALALMAESDGDPTKALTTLNSSADELRIALAIKQKQLRDDHASIATTQHDLAEVLLHLANYKDADSLLDEAEKLVRAAIAIQQKQFGPKHERVAESMVLLVRILQSAGRADDATAVRDALDEDSILHVANEKRERYQQRWNDLGPDRSETIIARNDLKDFLAAIGREEDLETPSRPAK